MSSLMVRPASSNDSARAVELRVAAGVARAVQHLVHRDRRDALGGEALGGAVVVAGEVVAAGAVRVDRDREAIGRHRARGDDERESQRLHALHGRGTIGADRDPSGRRVAVRHVAGLEVRRHVVADEDREGRRAHVDRDVGGHGRRRRSHALAQRLGDVRGVLRGEHRRGGDVAALVIAGLVEEIEERLVHLARVDDRGVDILADELRHLGCDADRAAAIALHARGDHQRVGRAFIEREPGVGPHHQVIAAERLRTVDAELREDRRTRAAIRRVGIDVDHVHRRRRLGRRPGIREARGIEGTVEPRVHRRVEAKAIELARRDPHLLEEQRVRGELREIERTALGAAQVIRERQIVEVARGRRSGDSEQRGRRRVVTRAERAPEDSDRDTLTDHGREPSTDSGARR
jgi:hypothetical protein